MFRSNHRIAFADFLRRVAAGKVKATEWDRFVVQHYVDEELEEIRRNLVRLSIDRHGGKEWSESEVAAMQHWSRTLKIPVPTEGNDWFRVPLRATLLVVTVAAVMVGLGGRFGLLPKDIFFGDTYFIVDWALLALVAWVVLVCVVLAVGLVARRRR
jgi:hypothetical protein